MKAASAGFGALTVRDARTQDYAAIRAVALRFFPAEFLLPDAEYRAILEQGLGVTRVASSQEGLAGYYALWLMRGADGQALLGGRLAEREIRAAMLLRVGSSDAACLVISDICAPQPGAGVRLLRDLRTHLRKTLVETPSIQSVIAWPASDDGRKLCARAGMEVDAAANLCTSSRAEILKRIS